MDNQITRKKLDQPFLWFLILFVALAVFRSVVDLPEQIIQLVSESARWMMVAAIAAIELRTNFGSVLRVQPSLTIILVLETLLLLELALLFTDFYLTSGSLFGHPIHRIPMRPCWRTQRWLGLLAWLAKLK